MTSAEMATYAFEQIDQARAELLLSNERKAPKVRGYAAFSRLLAEGGN